MRVLLDTSTLIAAMLPDHVHHTHAFPWLSGGKSGAFEFVCSAHTLAEVYAVMTRLPRVPAIRPSDALRLVAENIMPCARVLALAGDDYIALIESLARNNITGGAVYDAIIACVAQQANVDLLVTLNVAHFQQVWPAGSARIVSPQTHSPP